MSCDNLMNFFLLQLRGERRSISKTIKCVLRNMAEWSMSNIVEQSCKADDAALLGIKIQSIRHLPGNMSHPKRMIKTRMQRSGIDQRRHCQLPNASKSLKDIKVDQFHFILPEGDEIVNRISKF